MTICASLQPVKSSLPLVPVIAPPPAAPGSYQAAAPRRFSAVSCRHLRHHEPPTKHTAPRPPPPVSGRREIRDERHRRARLGRGPHRRLDAARPRLSGRRARLGPDGRAVGDRRQPLSGDLDPLVGRARGRSIRQPRRRGGDGGSPGPPPPGPQGALGEGGRPPQNSRPGCPPFSLPLSWHGARSFPTEGGSDPLDVEQGARVRRSDVGRPSADAAAVSLSAVPPPTA